MTGPQKKIIKPIPTLYNGIRFRSRLEARYAAFFDELGWPWNYEPFDLDGYIPDYIIDFEVGPVLFEVKGFDEEIEAACLKIEFSGWQKEAVIAAGDVKHSAIGQILEPHPQVFVWSTAELFYCISCGSPSLRAAEGSWRCRACGAGKRGGNEHVGELDPTEAWARAGNRVQWRPGT